MEVPNFTKTVRKTPYAAIDPGRDELSCKGKTVVVAGAGDGCIGAGIALSFARAGAPMIALIGRTESRLKETEAKIKAIDPDIKTYIAVADVSRTEDVGIAAHWTRVVLSAWDVFVNGVAHFPDPATIQGSQEDDWWKAFEVPLKFAQHFCKHFAPKARPNATYISLNASAAHMDAAKFRGLSAYSAAKLAAFKLNDYIADEISRIRVFTLHPGRVDAPQLQKLKTLKAELPSGSVENDMALPSDFCVWLASDESEFLRGRYIWASFDVDEMKERKAEFEKDPNLLRLQLGGWPWNQ